VISTINEEIKQLEKSDYDYESQDNYQMRENVWHQPSGEKANKISGFYTHYHNIDQIDSGTSSKSQQNPTKKESLNDIRKTYSGEDVLKLQEKVKN